MDVLKILNKNGINCEVIPANVDENQVKESLIKEKALIGNKIININKYLNIILAF